MTTMESKEDYLEAILILNNKNKRVRSVDIAEEMGVSKASVSVAMKNLREGGYIKVGDNHEIYLTKSGHTLAQAMYERHIFFSETLCSLGVDKKTALADACRMEHAMSEESFEALKKYFLEKKYK